MADDPLALGVRLANVSRRDLFGKALLLPLAALPAPARPMQLDAAAWRRARYDYDRAADRYWSFVEHEYRPACARMEAELRSRGDRDEARSLLFEKYRIRQLEDQGMDLLGIQFERMHALMATPAPDLPALSTKLQIVYRDVFLEEGDNSELVAELVADARRLI